METLGDLKARQDKGEHMMCPRCGQDTMDTDVLRNALSRYADIHICNECGTAEAMLAMMQNPLPLAHWACFKNDGPQSNFHALPGAIVLERLRKEQLPYLTRIFDRWHDEHEHEDFDTYQREAHHRCPGLTALWSQPFMAAYVVADGQLVIRFRAGEQGTEVATDLILKS